MVLNQERRRNDTEKYQKSIASFIVYPLGFSFSKGSRRDAIMD